MSSFISFTSILWFYVHRSFVSLGRFIPRYFILSVAMVNGIDSLISLFNFWLLLHRSAKDFCVLILYPGKLLNSLISSSNFRVASLGFRYYSIMSSAIIESFNCFPIWILFIFFPSLSTMANTFRTIQNNNGKSGHPGLFPDHRENALIFSQLRIMFAVFDVYGLYNV